MLKHFKLAACVLLLSAGFAACSDDDEPDLIDPTPPNYGPSAYVVNQGNFYSGVTGTMSYLNFADGSVTGNAFFNANSQHLGDTPQAPVRYGSKIYIPVFEGAPAL